VSSLHDVVSVVSLSKRLLVRPTANGSVVIQIIRQLEICTVGDQCIIAELSQNWSVALSEPRATM